MVEALKIGDLFGEVGPLMGAAQPYTITAEEDCTVLLLPADSLDLLCARTPGLAHAIAKRMARRLVHMSVMAVRTGGAVGAGAAAMPALPESPAPEPAAAAVAAKGVIPFVQVSEFRPDKETLAMIPQALLNLHRVIPLKLEGHNLTLGMVSPKSAAGLNELKAVVDPIQITPVAISAEDFADATTRFRLDAYRGTDSSKEATVEADDLVFEVEQKAEDAKKGARVIGDEVVRTVSKIFATAMQIGASDIHIEPEQRAVRVRFRVQGILQESKEYIPVSFASGISARVKVIAGLDVAERRMPQDGRIGAQSGRAALDLRVSTLPSSHGEKIVVRIMDPGALMRPLEDVFIDSGTLALVREALSRPFGAILVAGPTGSGKSSTLYSLINERKKTRTDTAIIMVEDPIEFRMPGITQVQANPSIGLGFTEVLRAMLRQDPDVIAIGEMRDAGTANLALEAAMTGHLVMSSIHGNTSLAVLQRLDNLGMHRPMMAQALSLVLVQRLVRKLCPHCLRLEAPPPALVEGLMTRGILAKGSSFALPRALGCKKCNETGSAGRVAVIEALAINQQVRDALAADGTLPEVEKIATETKCIRPFKQAASFLLIAKKIGPTEALMAVAR
jgi:type II secretory ATPase GspE/PulE/Tfp pilus assembly ATPase PilB-like protein